MKTLEWRVDGYLFSSWEWVKDAGGEGAVLAGD